MTRKTQFIALTVVCFLAITGSLVYTFSHPLRGPDVITIAGTAMLAFAWTTAAYFEITKMRTDEKGRYHYTVWGWFMIVVLKRPES
jgi:hypothetical protein